MDARAYAEAQAERAEYEAKLLRVAMGSTVQGKSEFMLRDGEVHVWSVSLDAPMAFTQRQLLLLSEEERLRADRFLFARGRTHFVCGRSVLRMLLARYLSAAPEEIVFCYGPNSKPELAPRFQHGKLHFNVSHSHGHLLVAIAKGFAVGVDLEKMRPEIDIDRIARRFFSIEEVQQLRALIDSTKRHGFFNCWTRKEAYLKARGDGIGYGLDQFAVSLDPGECARLLYDRRDPQAVECWSIHELQVAPGYAAALAVEAAHCKINRFMWDASSITPLGRS